VSSPVENDGVLQLEALLLKQPAAIGACAPAPTSGPRTSTRREVLDPDKTLAESVESPEKHVISHLSDFLFPPRRANSPVRMLSGGERNRLLLEALPAELEALEAEQKELLARMHAPDYYRQPLRTLRADRARNAEIEALLHEKLERWEALERKQKAANS